MDDHLAAKLIESNRALIAAMGMHWANEERKMNKESIAYTENDFYSLTTF